MLHSKRLVAIKPFLGILIMLAAQLACDLTPTANVTPTPVVVKMQAEAVVVVDLANVRAGPSEQSEPAGSVSRGVTLTVIGMLPDKSWYLVTRPEFAGRQVWIFGAFVNLAAKDATATVPAIPSLKPVDTPTVATTGTATLKPISTPSGTPTAAPRPSPTLRLVNTPTATTTAAATRSR